MTAKQLIAELQKLSAADQNKNVFFSYYDDFAIGDGYFYCDVNFLRVNDRNIEVVEYD